MSGRNKNSGRGGRFHGRTSYGRGGRGNSSGRSNNNQAKVDANKKSLNDYIYRIGSSKQASDFVTITKYLINHIKKTFEFGDDTAEALETRAEFDIDKFMPTMNESSDPDNAIKKRQDMQFRILYEAEITSFVNRKDKYKSNCGKSYAFIYGQCNKAMQAKIQARQDYSSKIKNNPIELLNAIEEHSLSYQENKYEMSVIFDALKNLVNLKQKDEESLIDYTARFKSAKDVFVAQLGDVIMLTKYVATMSEYSTKPNECKKEAFEQFLAYILLENSDRTKYGSMVTGLASQFALDNNQYPKTLVIATNVLSGHKWDATYSETKKKQSENAKNQKQAAQNKKKENEDEEQAPELSFVQLEGVSYCCVNLVINHQTASISLNQRQNGLSTKAQI